MSVGIAVRAAQSLGLDAPQSAAGHGGMASAQRHRLWQCCVFMDRSVSWVSGRVSTVALTAPGVSPAEQQGESDYQENAYFKKTLDLYEIANRAVLSHNPDCNGLADPHVGRGNDSGVSTVMQLEESIVKWETSLPLDLRLENFMGKQATRAENVTYRQAILLRLRIFHARIVLLKPMLARYCSSSQVTENVMMHKFLRDCAVLCIESAQKMTELVDQEHNPGPDLGSIMWWHRVFYLHVAGTVLLASMLQADDLFTQSVSRSWQTAMRALCAHAHLSVSVQQCVKTFETLSAKLSDAQHLVSGADRASVDPLVGCDEPFSSADFQDMFQDMGIDLDSCLFGIEDMAWTGNVL
ncbi:hypothetical protein FJTKL_09709 [Diaporthe vaccinii]|uniref:Transcription factor domain-containing protein n=1 Tax=Diaporthe vaccinii TaxID=105482 RepID=A0ABR4EMJ9_9PEZI